MVLEGVVTNVAAFGAFVDVGVHQDGLVHVSAMSEKFVQDPREVVKPGDIVKVKVQDVDIPRKRISLTMRLTDDAPAGGGRERRGDRGGRGGSGGGGNGGGQGDRRRGNGDRNGGRAGNGGGGNRGGRQAAAPQGAMADALRRAGLGR
jgi:protein Tex